MISSLIISAVLSLCFLQESPRDTIPGEYRAYLHFKWDDATFEDSYLGNEQAADTLADLIQRLGAERIESIDVTAYASPEGIYERNMMLSRKRAAQFKPAVASRLPEFSDRINVTAGGESWALLRDRVARDPKIRAGVKRQILDILDDPAIGDDTRKWRLAHKLEKSDYRYLLHAHYRYLRCFEIVVHFKEIEPEVVPEPEPVPEPKPEPIPEPEPVVEPEPIIEPVVEPQPTIIKKPVLAVSTNLIYDCTYIPDYGFTSIPSLSLEYYPSNYGHWSVGADVEWPMWQHWDTHRFLQIQNITLHTRYYFKKRDYRGLFALANVNVARYGIGWDAKGWEGEGLGASLGVGYKFTITGRLFMDMGVALGYFHSRYDPYEYGFDATQRYYYDYVGIPEDFVRRNHSLDWFGPTRVWISIGVDLFSRKIKK